MCCSPPVRPAVNFVRYVVVILLEQIIVWIVLALQPTPASCKWVMISSKGRYLERKKRPGIDTIKYHTWPKTTYWKVTKAQWNIITYREPRGQPFPKGVSPFLTGEHKAARNRHHRRKIKKKYPYKKHCLGMVRERNYWRAYTSFMQSDSCTPVSETCSSVMLVKGGSPWTRS